MVKLSSAGSFLSRLAALVFAVVVPQAFLLFPSVVSAEPVTFLFNIQIDHRCSVDACDSFSASFPVSMTMDDGVTGSVDNPFNHQRWYGVPVFSDIPLARPDIRADAARMYTPGFDTTFLYESGWRRVAHAYSGYEVTTDEGTFNWNTSLYRVEDNVWPLPELTPASMAEFLGSQRGSGFFGFNYSGQLKGGGLTPDSIAYLGTATLVTSQVPEPAGVLLIGTGLLALLWRRGNWAT